jgi:hypothetical protein
MVDPKDAARRLMIRNAREQTKLDANRVLAQEEGRRLARRILAEIPGTKAVFGFGSTWELWRTYRRNSDIDLAIDGGDVLAAMALAEKSPIPVDVLELSSCPAALAQFIRDRGVILAGSADKEGSP